MSSVWFSDRNLEVEGIYAILFLVMFGGILSYIGLLVKIFYKNVTTKVFERYSKKLLCRPKRLRQTLVQHFYFNACWRFSKIAFFGCMHFLFLNSKSKSIRNYWNLSCIMLPHNFELNSKYVYFSSLSCSILIYVFLVSNVNIDILFIIVQSAIHFWQ